MVQPGLRKKRLQQKNADINQQQNAESGSRGRSDAGSLLSDLRGKGLLL
jgi:hypothetical protein